MQEDRDRGQDRYVPQGGERPTPCSAGAEPSLRGGAQAEHGGAPRGERRRRRYSLEERTALLRTFHDSGLPVAQFCRREGVGADTLYRWLRGGGKRTKGQASRRSDGRAANASYSADQKRTALEALERSGRKLADFALLWGVSASSLRHWKRQYEEHGPQGLERRPRSKATGPGDRRVLSGAVRAEITRTKRRFPEFGMRKVRDFLRRFQGVRVSEGSVRKVLREEGIEPAPPVRKRRKKSHPPRRFERAKPGQLWQSDITSFVLRRHRTRVYLIVFLDDHSRYVVSWGLATHQKAPLVHETLLDGIARFGKPEEVLTDQGPQYFAWRGKAAFQKLLVREGIRHVVARTHHPQTVGKCERLWKTVGEEFWERARPEDLTEARERLGHWIAFYNHFRPHQGIGGLVPADRFFGAEDALRRTLEAQLSAHELALAVEEAPRTSVFLFGQIGDEQVSVHGERGRLVIQTPEGGRRELDSEVLGAPPRVAPAEAAVEETADALDAHGDEPPFGAGVLS